MFVEVASSLLGAHAAAAGVGWVQVRPDVAQLPSVGVQIDRAILHEHDTILGRRIGPKYTGEAVAEEIKAIPWYFEVIGQFNGKVCSDFDGSYLEARHREVDVGLRADLGLGDQQVAGRS